MMILCQRTDSCDLPGMAANTSETRRVLLDFAFVDPSQVPGTYCSCILPEVGDRRLKLSEYKTWTRCRAASAANNLPEENNHLPTRHAAVCAE